jgi:hypothetical protein
LRATAKIFASRGQFAQVIGILNGMKVDEKLIFSIINFVNEGLLIVAKSNAVAIKDPSVKNLFLTSILKRLLKYPTVSS